MKSQEPCLTEFSNQIITDHCGSYFPISRMHQLRLRWEQLGPGLSQDHTVIYWQTETIPDLLTPIAEHFLPHDIDLIIGLFVWGHGVYNLFSILFYTKQLSGNILNRETESRSKREKWWETQHPDYKDDKKVRFSPRRTSTRKLEKGFNLWISGNPGNLHLYRARIKTHKGLG